MSEEIYVSAKVNDEVSETKVQMTEKDGVVIIKCEKEDKEN